MGQNNSNDHTERCTEFEVDYGNKTLAKLTDFLRFSEDLLEAEFYFPLSAPIADYIVSASHSTGSEILWTHPRNFFRGLEDWLIVRKSWWPYKTLVGTRAGPHYNGIITETFYGWRVQMTATP